MSVHLLACSCAWDEMQNQSVSVCVWLGVWVGVKGCESQQHGEHWGPGRPCESQNKFTESHADISLRPSPVHSLCLPLSPCLWPKQWASLQTVYWLTENNTTLCVSAAVCIHMGLISKSNKLLFLLSVYIQIYTVISYTPSLQSKEFADCEFIIVVLLQTIRKINMKFNDQLLTLQPIRIKYSPTSWYDLNCCTFTS